MNTRLVQTEKVGARAADCTTENLIHMIATDGKLVLLEELLEHTNINVSARPMRIMAQNNKTHNHKSHL